MGKITELTGEYSILSPSYKHTVVGVKNKAHLDTVDAVVDEYYSTREVVNPCEQMRTDALFYAYSHIFRIPLNVYACQLRIMVLMSTMESEFQTNDRVLNLVLTAVRFITWCELNERLIMMLSLRAGRSIVPVGSPDENGRISKAEAADYYRDYVERNWRNRFK
jgi:hypothetical protein